MDFYNYTPTLQEVAERYQNDINLLRSAASDMDLNKRFNEDLKIDHRDFFPMVMIDDVPGSTDEERKEVLSQRLRDIVTAFEDPDPSKRTPYLDAMYNMRDNFRPDKVDMNDPQQVRQLIAYGALSQTYAVKREENPEYFSQRYPTPADRNYDAVLNHYLDSVCSVVMSNLYDKNFLLDPGPSLPYRMDASKQPYIKSLCEYAGEKLKDAELIRKGEEGRDYFFLTVPDKIMEFSKIDPSQIPSLSSGIKFKAWDFVTLCVDASFMQADSKDLSLLQEAALFPRSALFIDGMPVAEFTRSQYPASADPKLTESENASSIACALLSPKHRVEMVRCVRDENGEMKLEPKEIRQKFTPEQEQRHLMSHSWFRRTFFNWGPFRIESLQEQADRAAASDPNREERHQKICSTMKAKIEEGIDMEQTRLRKKQEREEKEKVHNLGVKKEHERLSEKAEQWDKSTAIGVLAQDVKAGYQAAFKGFMYKGEQRTAIVAEGLAKLVLFEQLCQERALGGNVPGPMETRLLGDGSPEQLRQNIALATKQIAEDKPFRDLIAQKCPNLTKVSFEDAFMLSGGYERLAAEYMQKLKDSPETSVEAINKKDLVNDIDASTKTQNSPVLGNQV